MKKLTNLSLLSIIAVTPLFATSGTSKAIELSRSKAMDKVAQREDTLSNTIAQYIKSTLDTTPTRAELQQYYGLSTEYFKNYRNETCLDIDADGLCDDNISQGITIEFDEANKSINIGNLLGDPTTISTDELNYFNNSTPYRSAYAEPNLDNTKSSFNFVGFSKLQQTIDIINEAAASTSITASLDEPADITQVWLKPNGDGTFDSYIYDSINSTWKNQGTIKSVSDETSSASLTFYADDGFDTITTVGKKGWSAKVEEDGVFMDYIHNGTEWIPTGMTANNEVSSLFNGTGTVIAMATSKFNSSGGSIMDSNAPNGEWGGSKTFTKKDDATAGGYWKTEDNMFLVTDSIASVNTFSDLFLTGATAWIANGADNVYKLEKKTLPDASTAWVYITQDYATALNLTTTQTSNSDGEYIFVSSHNEYIRYNSTLNTFEPHPLGVGITYITNDSNGRNNFFPETGKTYLTQTNDCDSLNCNGDAGSNFYAGTTIDGLYAYYYSNSGKNLNALTDASPYDNWNTFWTDEASAVQWNGAQFGEVNTGDILVKETLNGSIAYNRSGDLINKANGYIIPQGKLPTGFNASTATISQFDSKNWVDVADLDEFGTDTNLDIGYTVNLTGSGFTNKKIQRCSDYSDNMQWSDNCLDIAASTVAITDGSRSDLIAPNDGTRVNITKNVGVEANYTTTGVAYSDDTSWKQWFYSTSGTITQNMLDSPPCNSSASCYALATPVALHSTAGLITKEVNGFWMRSSGTYLNADGKWNNQFFAINASVSKPVPSSIAGQAGNGLYYTQESGTFRIDTEFGVTTWSTATMNSVNDRDNTTNVCASKGMRLPTLAETTGTGATTYVPAGGSMGNTNGVPSHPSGYTWTASSQTSGTSYYWLWNGTTSGSYINSVSNYVRCVR